MINKFEWEPLEISFGEATWRAKVFKGWIVRTDIYQEREITDHENKCISMIFISDPNHEWDVELYV